MDISEAGFKTWFGDCTTRVDNDPCLAPWHLMDIQPNGDANFCIDFPDAVLGSIKNQSIHDIWTGDRANRFRDYIQRRPLPICARCGVKYMAKDMS